MRSDLSSEELQRYARQITLPELGPEGQKRIRGASVLVIGAGGLGCPALIYLAAAGIGKIGIVDYDKVDISNLHRQIIYSKEDIGKYKAKIAAEKIKHINPLVSIEPHVLKLDSTNALDLLAQYDIIIDGSDNFPTRYLVNDASVLLCKPNVYAAVFRFTGQVTVFNHKDAQGNFGPNYRDLHAVPPPAGSVPSCAEGGVLGVLPGILGSMQAAEAIKIACGIGQPLSGRMFVIDTQNFDTTTISFSHDPDNPFTAGREGIGELIDYESWCGAASDDRHGHDHVKEIDPVELKKMMDDEVDFQLIDVREPYELEIASLNGKLIPMNMIPHQVDEISRQSKVVIYCRSGIRSAQAILYLQQEFQFTNLWNLQGGILAYADQVDPNIPRY